MKAKKAKVGRTTMKKGGKPKKPKTAEYERNLKNWPKKIKDKEPYK